MSTCHDLRLGVLGGTFDPIHFGHIAVGLQVRHRLRLDVVLFVVANDPWQKSPFQSVTPASLRLEMVRAAVDDQEGLEASTLEIDRGGESYTADTLTELHDIYPGADLYLIVGSDVAAGLGTWKRPREVESLATTVVIDRPGKYASRPPDPWRYLVLDGPDLDISSADIRTRFAEGRPVDTLVPGVVTEVVRAHGLYT